jgi:lysozyme
MKTNAAGMKLIKEKEGLRLTAYLDMVGVPTIGWGCTKGVTHDDVVNKRTITQDQAEQMLQNELLDFENGIPRYVTVPLNENQFAALVSFTYNLGLGSLQHSTLLQKLNANDMAGAADEFPKWDHAGGHEVETLKERRLAEQALFNTPVDGGGNPPDGPSDADINVSLEDIENEVLKK